MEGGGTLGIALLGYLHALEQAKVRFLDIGGTSAGAITALLLAAVDTKDKPKSSYLLERLAAKDLSEFMDSSGGVKRFLNAWLAKRPKLLLALNGPAVVRAVLHHLGLNPGQAFYDWMVSNLEQRGIFTVQDLDERMKAQPQGLRRRDGQALSPDDCEAHLALIAAEVTTETKVEFPRMAKLFWKNWEEENPALFVRASMSVPFFFYPLTVELPDLSPEELQQRWALASFADIHPREKVHLVDGGIMSNFPINLFHVPGVPSAPTFGARLGMRKKHTIQKPAELGRAIFDSARHCLDYDFILQHRDYKHLLTTIDTGPHGWLDFNLSKEAQVDLFARGVKAGAAFLNAFNWEDYKEEREKLAREQQPPAFPPQSPRGASASGFAASI
nr:patatin-like phospholipase family protein [Myxococcus sp. RHSTA-1-4]